MSRTMVAVFVLGASLAGCAADNTGRGAAETGDGDANARASMEDAGATGDAAGRGAAGAGGGGIPPGSLTPEQLADQVERDLVDLQRLNAARRTSGAAGGNTPGGGASTAERAMLASESSRGGANTPVAGAGVGGGATAPPAPPPGSGATIDERRSGADTSVAADDGDGVPAPALTPSGARRVPETTDALASAAAALYRDASRADTPLRSLMALAALSIAEPDRPFNPEALPDLTEEERRTVARFHGFCRELGRQLAASDDPDAVARSVEQLAREIKGERSLRVPRGEFCSQVDGFGVYRAIAPREFVAHSGARFALYFEVDGYRSVEVGSEGWKTELAVELSILSERDGVPVWRRDWQTITDLASTQRKDFFVTHAVTVPDALSVGGYALKIRVRDELTGALAEQSVPFRMVAAATGAPTTGSAAPGGAPMSGASSGESTSNSPAAPPRPR